MLTYKDSSCKTIFDQPDKKNYFEQEQAFVQSKFKMLPTNEEEEVDIVIQWSMPKLNKRGFYCLFKIPLLKIQKQITEQQKKLERQKIAQAAPSASGKDLTAPIGNKITPLHLAYQYTKHLKHDFSTNRPAIVTFSLSLSNMIQSTDYMINCKVEGINEWATMAAPTDVSEANGFLWIGKTQHIIRNLKTNDVKQVMLKCAVLRPGVYNLNRFRVAIIEGQEEGETNSLGHFVNEVRLPDDILVTVTDTAAKQVAQVDLASQNLITFD
ncbi:hypothetical protein FGO68_gene10057 [Halteria grandinella]|uniref:TPPC8 C-terminal Ig-like domain-containing protein n=1 Tax=Halteria grandinella TaxID=5974 RepID=A0A8J8SUQ3_HALGN|nr:hypothetical protein FGO68_gene10057 [Halteria grandinella]